MHDQPWDTQVNHWNIPNQNVTSTQQTSPHHTNLPVELETFNATKSDSNHVVSHSIRRNAIDDEHEL